MGEGRGHEKGFGGNEARKDKMRTIIITADGNDGNNSISDNNNKRRN